MSKPIKNLYGNLQDIFVNCERSDSGCIEWQGTRRLGYGIAYHDKKIIGVHRLALIFATGVSGPMALHSCDNPPCVNPDHLRWGTAKENSYDMVSRWRSGRAKLSEQDVLAIREAYAPKRPTLRELADQYGVSVSVIHALVNNQTWKHL